MKTSGLLSFLGTLVLFALASCATNYLPYVSDEYLTSLGFSPHEQQVEVFFEGESKPTRSYYRLAIMREQVNLNANSSKVLIDRLTRRSQRLGADALIVISDDSYERILTDVSIDNTYSYPQETMMALAIKYSDQIEYQANILTHAKVTPTDPDMFHRGGQLLFSPSGEVTGFEGGRLAEYAYDYSLELLWQNRQGWWYKASPSERINYPAGVVKRRFLERRRPYHQVTAHLLDQDQPGLIVVNRVRGQSRTARMELTYDEEGRITSRSWKDPFKGDMRAEREYDQQGHLTREIFHRKWASQEEEVLFVVTYNYLSLEDWEEALTEEQIVIPSE